MYALLSYACHQLRSLPQPSAQDKLASSVLNMYTARIFSPKQSVEFARGRCVECWGWHLSLNIDHLLFLSTSSDAVGDGLADSL